MTRRLQYICKTFQAWNSTPHSTIPSYAAIRSYSRLRQSRDDEASRAEKEVNSNATEEIGKDKKVSSKTTKVPETVKGDDKHQKYYSLKNYREGPNTESGEVDSRFEEEEVKTHNKDMRNRRGKN
ncbi:hypothetical protein AtubIFM54640_008613 [Aspergillus tubingensis]|nr:hypothetical protein AtubIFM54640_008613 [Aspergillus tubingensis]